MDHKVSTVGTDTQEAKEHRAHQVVETLKNDIIEEIQSSEESDQTELSANSKIKKSIFSNLISRKHARRPKMRITKKIETCSTINFGTESLSSDQEQADTCTLQSPLSEEDVNTRKIKQNFLKKMIKCSVSNPTRRPMLGFKYRGCSDADSCKNKQIVALNSIIPTAYISPRCSVKLLNGMNELQNILHNLHQSEQHVIYLLKKYIEDRNLHKQLFEASSEYLVLQNQSKNQVNILANKMWMQQTEANKIQETHLQNQINVLVKTNRNLEMQFDILCRHCEKLTARSNLYPKRFLHLRSFGKVYARQLIENNRKLQRKLYSLTNILSDLEDEFQKLQKQKRLLEDEKRTLRTEIHHLQGITDKNANEWGLEKSALIVQINHKSSVIQNAASAAKYVFQDLHEYEYQLKDFAIKIAWPNVHFKDTCLPEMIHQIRDCVGELFMTIITAYRNISLVAKDVTKLRSTNARLQENLHKSTSELDSLCKKLERSGDIDVNLLESHCQKLQQENYILKTKLEDSNEENSFLKKELDSKKKSINEERTNMESIESENSLFLNNIDQLIILLSQLSQDDLSKKFISNQEKLEYLKLRCSQLISDQKHLTERCKTLDEDNQNLLQSNESYQQDLATLQEEIGLLCAENEVIKKQLASEHQTVSSLQNERLKYLEEKNLLKTVFQHLKSEVSRVQQLEGAVADMSKETNRLSLIAEFNKQLGEQLKSEVETKENTIAELKQNLEKLSHLQIDNDKEKLSLCARLSEIINAKEKLSNCLEMEVKKNLHLDESKKKLEDTTKSQLKIYEEMQRNERAALKELLKDFRCLIKQRDCLVSINEESRRKYKEMEKNIIELKKQYESAVAENNRKEEEIKQLAHKIEQLEEHLRQEEEKYNYNVAKYEKTLKKYDKLLGQKRKEKEEVESSNIYLKKNMQKLQSELDQLREKAATVDSKLAVKNAQSSTIESELNEYKKEIQRLSNEHGKAVIEIEYMKKMHEQQIAELKAIISNYTNKDTMYVETQSTVLSKEHQISELTRLLVEREAEIKRIEHECNYLKKQNEDQQKIMIGYENQIVILQDAEANKVKVENDFKSLEFEYKNTLTELENVQKENETLKNNIKALITKSENERSFYHNQANEILLEYSEQKATIEEEIDSISSQLRSVTANLHEEKHRFDELAAAHDNLQIKYAQLQESLAAEMEAHSETNNELKNMNNYIKSVESTKNNLQDQLHLVLLEMNEYKDRNLNLSKENKDMQSILEQGKQQYTLLLNRNKALQEELQKVRAEVKILAGNAVDSQKEIDKLKIQLEEKTSELKSTKERSEKLKKELTEGQKVILELKDEFYKLQEQATGLEFKNCELTLQLHEAQARLETERNLYKELKDLEDLSQQTPSGGGELSY